MSKTNTEKQPAHVAELLLNGTATLRAKTREKLDEMVQHLPVDVKIAAGVVCRNRETGDYVLRVDIMN